MEGNAQQQKNTPLARELTRVFTSYGKHAQQLKKNLKETNAFFREIRQNYSNACASTMSSASASLEAGRFEHYLEMRLSTAPIFKTATAGVTLHYGREAKKQADKWLLPSDYFH